MEETKFKVGDMVMRKEGTGSNNGLETGVVKPIAEIKLYTGCNIGIKRDNGVMGWHDQINIELVKGKAERPKKEVDEWTQEKFMSYGVGCGNTDKILNTEKELKEQLKLKQEDSAWTGRIIGYRLTPIYEVETKTVIKSFTKRRKYKKRKK